MSIDLKARRAAIAARLTAATLSPADKAEQEDRAALAKEEAEAADAERVKRDLDLARRLDAARAALPGVPVDSLAIKDSPHSFIVQDPGGKAYTAWEKGIQPVALGGNPDRAAVSRDYAVAAVYDHNGTTDWNAETAKDTSTAGADLIALLRASPGIATNIVNVATRLAGLASEERKS